jgi:hypothetical protein
MTNPDQVTGEQIAAEQPDPRRPDITNVINDARRAAQRASSLRVQNCHPQNHDWEHGGKDRWNAEFPYVNEDAAVADAVLAWMDAQQLLQQSAGPSRARSAIAFGPAPDDTEVDAEIAEATDLGDALFGIASKYLVAVTNNEPRWQDGVWLREMGEFIDDVKNVTGRFAVTAPGNTPASTTSQDVHALELTDEERLALPAEFHRPVFDGLGAPHSWICSACWGDGFTTSWPCEPATRGGLTVARAAGFEFSH